MRREPLLPLRIGQGRAADWLLRVEPIAASEALAAGFINRIEADPAAALRAQAQALTERPLVRSKHTVLYLKHLARGRCKTLCSLKKQLFALLKGP